MIKSKKKKEPEASYLGDYLIPNISFPKLDAIFEGFKEEEFLKRSSRKRFHRINQVLLQLILESQHEAFLLPAVIEFIGKVNQCAILREHYHISQFEFWLNHFSELTDHENYEVRGKITGKFIPREEYQVFFPIGMGKIYNGTHFVSAHLSPDVDTMIASFWGWLDAFSARIGNSRHVWSLPGGPPDSPITQIFADMFGQAVFDNVAHSSGSLTLSAIDLVTQKGVVKKSGTASLSALELSSNEKAVFLVDEKGHFLGDWHSADVEPIRKIVIRFKSCLRWFENNLHVKLISLFTKKDLHVDDLRPFLSSVFESSIYDCEPVKEFTDRQKKDLDDFFLKVLGLQRGLHSTFAELNHALTKLSAYELSKFQAELESLKDSELFDSAGYLREDRPAIFHRLEKIIDQLDKTIHHIRDYVEQLDVALDIKRKVFGISSQFVTMRSDIEDIRIKMKKHEYLTVVVIEEEDKLFPVGVVWASAIQKQTLGTVTFRDFCNQEEIRMAPYLTPISVIDHHKSSLHTASPPLALIGDTQSCNVLIAEQVFNMNSRYGLGGVALQEIQNDLLELQKTPPSPSNMRLMQRLAQRQLAAATRQDYFVHPDRELFEYLCFLHAILDDTDLLNKVSKRDVECVVELINRYKSLTVQREVEIINLDGIPRDKDFAKQSAKRILQHPEVYSLYRKIYERKEHEIERNLMECQHKHYASLFLDTKEQNGCCRVGQTKLFTRNHPLFLKNAQKLMEFWLAAAHETVQIHPEIDLHLHMVSTIPSADEVYTDKVGQYSHLDQLWFWVPYTQKAYDHLASFLTAFMTMHQINGNAYLEFFSDVNEDVQQIFIRNCPHLPIKQVHGKTSLPMVILHFTAGTLNSRKAMITPYLPRII